MATSQPHDTLFRATFSDLDCAKSQIALLLPKKVLAELDLNTLEISDANYVGSKLKQSRGDILYRVRTRSGRAGYIAILYEHQSRFDRSMPLRVLRYMVDRWERCWREKPRPAVLPFLIPLVLYHGNEAWAASPELASMFDMGSSLDEALRPFTPHFQFVLDNLSTSSAQDIAMREALAPVRMVLFLFWARCNFIRLTEAAPLMKAVGPDVWRNPQFHTLAEQMATYYFALNWGVERSELKAILEEIITPEGEETMGRPVKGSLARMYMDEGHENGLRTAIESVLSTRSITLSEIGRTRLAACADMAKLNAWLVRAITASCESDVFAG